MKAIATDWLFDRMTFIAVFTPEGILAVVSTGY